MVDRSDSHPVISGIKFKTDEEINKLHFHPHKGHAELQNFKLNEDTYFNGDFQKIVRNEKEAFNREMYQIIRRYQYTFKALSGDGLLSQPFVAFECKMTTSCNKEEFKKAIIEAVTPVYL